MNSTNRKKSTLPNPSSYSGSFLDSQETLHIIHVFFHKFNHPLPTLLNHHYMPSIVLDTGGYMLIKKSSDFLCGNGTVEYLGCGGTYTHIPT